MTRRSTQLLAGASASTREVPKIAAIHVTIASSASPMATFRSALNPNVTRPLRWLEWGFDGSAVDDPWGDRRDDRWYVAPAETLDDLLRKLAERGRRSRE